MKIQRNNSQASFGMNINRSTLDFIQENPASFSIKALKKIAKLREKGAKDGFTLDIQKSKHDYAEFSRNIIIQDCCGDHIVSKFNYFPAMLIRIITNEGQEIAHQCCKLSDSKDVESTIRCIANPFFKLLKVNPEIRKYKQTQQKLQQELNKLV